jgi:hypothetical protein
MDNQGIVIIFIKATSLVAAFAAIMATIIISRFLNKFATGILAMGFKTIGIGIGIIALGIVIDTIQIYIQAVSNSSALSLLLIVRQIFFVLGTYVIIIGSKNMGDKLAELSKHKSS